MRKIPDTMLRRFMFRFRMRTHSLTITGIEPSTDRFSMNRSPSWSEHAGLGCRIGHERKVELWLERLWVDPESEQAGKGRHRHSIMDGHHIEHCQSAGVIDFLKDLTPGLTDLLRNRPTAS